MLGTATHALGIIHSHSESARLRTTERGSTTGSFRQPVAEIGQMRGLFHRRLLGAHLLRRRAGCLQPEIGGPLVLATAPTLLVPVRPGSSLQCSGSQSHISSISHHSSSAPCHPTGPPRPVRSAAQRSRRAPKRKTGLEVRGVRRCPWLCTAPLGRRPVRASCNRLSYAKADSCPPPCSQQLCCQISCCH